MEYLISLLVPIVATFVSTLMGTEAFKWVVDKTGLNISARKVTWAVWAVVALIIWAILDLMPFWLVLVVGVLAMGTYAGVLKPVFGLIRNRDGKVPPIGGGGGGPIIKP